MAPVHIARLQTGIASHQIVSSIGGQLQRADKNFEAGKTPLPVGVNFVRHTVFALMCAPYRY